MFPFIPLIAENTAQNLRTAFHLDDALEGEFDFNPLHVAGFTPRLAEVFLAMKSFEGTISSFSNGSVNTNLDLPLVSDERNLIMHTLMSLPSAAIAGGSSAASSIYETARLAAILYGVGVIFPLPASSAPFEALVKELLMALQQQGEWDRYRLVPQLTQLKLWILTIGGIAAESIMPMERSLCMAQIRKLLGEIRPSSRFTDYKYAVLKPILWLDVACDAAGERLWREMELL